jgi:hypothetical protein
MLRLLGSDPVGAYRSFFRLVKDYRAVLGTKLAEEHDISRALRDGARALARDRSRWDEVAAMQGLSRDWAARSPVRRLQQQFHTLLDEAAFAILRKDVSNAEVCLQQADHIFITAQWEGQDWMDHRVAAKHGLVHAAFCALAGEPHHAAEVAQAWCNREEPVGNAQACDTARGIINWVESECSGALPVEVLLR